MKSIKIFAVAGAIGLLGMAGLSSCKKNNNPEGPGYNGEVVKTEFSIAVPDLSGSQKAPDRRYMPGTIVQREPSEFNGITGITLVPFAREAATPEAKAPIQASDSRLGVNITLDDLEKAEISAKTSKAKVYSNVSIPLTTASFLFYGKSKVSGTKFEKGSLIENNLEATNPSSFYFDLEPIYTSARVSSGKGKLLLDYLNSVASAEDESDAAWYTYIPGADKNAAMTAMFETFKTMHGLSSFEVARVLSDINKSLKPLDNGDDVNPNFARKIRNAISGNACCFDIDAQDNVVLQSTGENACSDFPQNLNLPEGSIEIEWQGAPTNKFVEKNYAAASLTDPATYVYPAELWYFVNSSIKTSNTTQAAAYTSTTNTWQDILDLHTSGTGVNSLTRAVAIKDKIQYGVGRLVVTVKLNGNSLDDNGYVAQGVTNSIDCSSGFKVTAILVGNQKQVGFNFVPNGSGTEYTIYDNIMTSTVETTPADMVALPSVASAPNSTLVLETPTTQDVKIAVEMENGEHDFYGVNGQLIPAHGKFYVIATLSKDVATSDALTAAGKSGCVFAQDFNTYAYLTLKSLKNAYNTIPDLRTPKLELGFSVDLTWQVGHEYNINIE